MTSLDIELALARYFGVLPKHGGMASNRNLLIPNFTALQICHECDLLLVTKSGWAHEIEIKVSRSDLIRDAQKEHQHYHGLLSRLWFAMPDTMVNCVDLIPDRAGILLVCDNGFVKIFRTAKKNMGSRKLTTDEMLLTGRIAGTRIWTLKKKLKEKS